MRSRHGILLIFGFLALGCVESKPPAAKGPQPVKWVAEVAGQTPSPDGSVLVNVRIRATIDDGWHVYAPTQSGEGPTPLTVKVEPEPLISLASKIDAPAPEKSMDPNFGIETETYSGQPVIMVPVRVSAEALKSGKPIDVKVRSQACSDKFCLPAKTTTLSVTIPASKT
ncbi:MAG TPA: protein-disulfide reductase DsbD N-terminal domain-containing protein [Gemmatimonadaceae bacterium]|nr:protein-disulfide reductase DsbD N-terminal domain-containing protein [Gemmatimonadaceae bacterium]